MQREQFSRLTIGSTLGELPGIEKVFDVATRAGVVGQLFERHPELPGVLVSEGGEVTSAVSRRYYLDTIGRFLGHDVFTPRPLSVLLRRFQELGGALVLPAATPITEAVRRGLARARELVYEPVVVAALPMAPARLVDFEDLLLADSRLTQLRNAQMRQILGTVHEGLLLVDPDHRIAAEHSDSVAAIFTGAQIGDRRFEELLADGLDAERCSLAADYLDTLFDPRVIESLVVKVNPLLRVTMELGGRRKELEFRFARGGEGGRIQHVLVRIEDVSRREELARELEVQRQRADQRLALALALAQAEAGEAASFLSALDGALRALAGSAERGLDDGAVVEHARSIHRLKGEAAVLALQPFELALHRLEDGLGGAGRAASAAAVLEAAAAVDALRGDAMELVDRFASLAALRSGAARPAATLAPAPPLLGAGDDPWAGMLPELERLASRVASDLGKRARLLATADEPGVLRAWRPLLRNVLVQLVRNAVAHGIEPLDERLRRGKPSEGVVQLALRHHADSGWLELIVQDDGRGLDPERVRQRAAELGVGEAPAEGWAELLFRPGFTTVERPHLHAGRGVGLDAVRELVETRGGRVELHSERGRFCAVQVLLPLPVAAPAEARGAETTA